MNPIYSIDLEKREIKRGDEVYLWFFDVNGKKQTKFGKIIDIDPYGDIIYSIQSYPAYSGSGLFTRNHLIGIHRGAWKENAAYSVATTCNKIITWLQVSKRLRSAVSPSMYVEFFIKKNSSNLVCITLPDKKEYFEIDLLPGHNEKLSIESTATRNEVIIRSPQTDKLKLKVNGTVVISGAPLIVVPDKVLQISGDPRDAVL